MTIKQLDPAIWSRVFGYLLELKPPTEFTERNEFGQPDLATVCRVSSVDAGESENILRLTLADESL